MGVQVRVLYHRDERHVVGPADVVVVKPNIGWDRTPEQAVNTDPQMVAEVVRLCRDARTKRVIVADCPVSKARAALPRSGIEQAARAAGARSSPTRTTATAWSRSPSAWAPGTCSSRS
jgi:uncharacterized protein (DUF362 family)